MTRNLNKYTTPHLIRVLTLKKKERRNLCREAKDKSNVKMWISSIAKSGDLIANLKKKNFLGTV